MFDHHTNSAIQPQVRPPTGNTSSLAISSAARLYPTPGDEVVALLRLVDPEGVHHLVGMLPGAGPSISLNRRVSTDADEIRDWVNKYNGVYNLYWTANEIRPGAVEKHKPSGNHVVAIRVVHVDIDLPGANTEEELDRLLAEIRQKLPVGVEATIIIDSGGGFQLIFVLDRKLPVADAREAIEALNNGLIAHFGGDKGTYNIDRLVRLAGTMNLPNALKTSKGRSPRRSAIVETTDARHTIAGLGRSIPPVEPEESVDRTPRVNELMAHYQGAHYQTATLAELEPSLSARLHADLEATPILEEIARGDFSNTRQKGAGGKRSSWATNLGSHGSDYDEDEFAEVTFAVFSENFDCDYCDQQLDVRQMAKLRSKYEIARADFRARKKAPAVDVEAVYEKVPPRELKLPRGIRSHKSLIDAKVIPQRRYVMFPALLEGDVCQVVGEPGISKSSLMLTFALAIAANREDLISGPDGSFGPERLYRSGPAIVFNAEDRADEMDRRLVVAQRAAGIVRMDNEVHIWSGIDSDDLQIMVRAAKDAPLARSPKAQLLEDLIEHTGAVFVALDPQVGLMSGGHENDADDMNALFAELTRISTRHKCAIMVVHHSAKSSRNDTGDMGMGRGSFAQAGKVRSQMTLTNVDPADAEKWGYSPNDDLFQLGYGKVSYGPKPRAVKVLRRNNATVGNGIGANGGDPFSGNSRERAERMGDSAPELEIIGLVDPRRGKAAHEGETVNPVQVRRMAVAEAAAKVMGDREAVALPTVFNEIGGALNEAGVSKATSRPSITDLVKTSLAGAGVQIMHDGQNVLVNAEQRGVGPKATWFLVIRPVELEGHEALEGDGVFS